MSYPDDRTYNVKQQQIDENIFVDFNALVKQLITEVDHNIQLEKDVKNVLLQISNDFIDDLIKSACMLAKHRKSKIIEVKDIQIYLERQYNMWTPGFEFEERCTYKQPHFTTEAHKQRMKVIKKVRNKY